MKHTSPQPSSYPDFAPLPFPIFQHLLRRFERKGRGDDGSLVPLLEKEVRQKRGIAFAYMNPFVRAGLRQKELRDHRFSTAWLLRTLAEEGPEKKPIPYSTLSYWHGRGLLQYSEHGLPEFDSAAALCIARMIDQGERNWLPSIIGEAEPHWWCWRQDDPESQPLLCPIPLPADLPSKALLWTPWAGASWDPHWVLIGKDLGAIRWAGVKRDQFNARHWGITTEDIERWDPLVATLTLDIPREEPQELVQTLATLALHRLARTRISPAFARREDLFGEKR